MTESDSEPALTRRAQAGDRDAFGALVEKYKSRAYVQALAIVGSREDALDLSQEAFVRAYRARHTLDPQRPFYPWLNQILRRLCFNFLRDTRAHARIVQPEGAEWLEAAAPDGYSDPAAAAERTEARRRVAAAIEQLPPHEREVLVLKEFDGMKYREIADVLAVPIGTVMSRLYSARKRLANALEDQR